MRHLRTCILPVIFFILNFSLFSQEYISGISCIPAIKTFLKNNPDFSFKTGELKSSLELPFWDDFSQSELYPNSLLWQNFDVYINSTLAGIATFDAVDPKGELYSNAGYETSFIADSLTSQAINLNYPGDESIFLSFFYQPQGIVEAPETQDSLILQFLAPEENKWYTVWYSEGFQNTNTFNLVMIPVNEDKFLKDGFQFQFFNYASLGSSTYPSLAVNCDFWHIDYVYLNRNRTVNDTLFRDIAFNKPLKSLLRNYESVPWSHFKAATNIDLVDVIQVEFKNNSNQIGVIDSLNFSLTDLSGNSPVQNGYGGNNIINPYYQYTFLYSEHPFTFPKNTEEFCDFSFNTRIVTSSSDSSQNNRLSYIQKFRDYYAYDDGSAEAGYGITGNGAKFGSVAYYFEPLKDDYIRGVYMYFTHAYDEASQKYFWLNVWNTGENNLPDTLIMTMEGQLPSYSNELNEFVFYEFEEPIYITGPFFIGWTQTTEDKLNIGFDLNTNANDKLFYNLYGEWVQSSIEGAVMMRPLIGNSYTSVDVSKTDAITIYPNPAIDFIYFNPPLQNHSVVKTELFDIQGRLLKNEVHPGSNTLNISDLTPGIYFIKFTDLKGYTQISKFIKK
jgi:hypothetical protein